MPVVAKTEPEKPAWLVKHQLQVARRAAYLATLTPKQLRVRDDYVAWIRWWKREYTKLAKTIKLQKAFVRGRAHNNLETLGQAMRGLEKHRLQARTMLLARRVARVDFLMNMGGK